MNILVVQNRMGMGDLVIFMPFIEAISKKYKVPITCLVKKNFVFSEYSGNRNDVRIHSVKWDESVHSERSHHIPGTSKSE